MQGITFKVSRNKLLFFAALVVFRCALDFSYYNIIADVFVYDGFTARLDYGQYMLSWLLYSISFIFVNDRIQKVGHYFFAMAVLSVIAPLTSIYGLEANKSLFPVVITLVAIFLIYYVSSLSVFSFRKLPVVVGGEHLAIAIAVAFVVFLVVWFPVSGARPNFDLSKVYEYREVNSELTGGGILAYTNNWTYQVFSVYLISFSLYYRRYVLVLILLLIQLYFFSIASHKSILFLPFLVLGTWMYFRYSNSLLVLPVAYTAIICVTIISFYFFDDLLLSSLLSRRVFFVPANLCFAYFDFFSNNPHVYWSNSVLSAFSAYPYGDLGVPYVIGEYLERPGVGANNGFVSSGFAHAGLFGVFFYAIIIGLIIRLINDMTSESMPIWVAVAISVVPLRSLLISSDLFTVMLTHGFGMAIVLIYLSRNSRSSTALIGKV